MTGQYLDAIVFIYERKIVTLLSRKMGQRIYLDYLRHAYYYSFSRSFACDVSNLESRTNMATTTTPTRPNRTISIYGHDIRYAQDETLGDIC